MTAVRVANLCKSFDGRRKALDAIDLEIARGEMVALIGASGSGKSTLIRHISSLARCDRGEIEVFGLRVQDAGSTRLSAAGMRREVGVIFQQFNLVDRLSLLTNVLLGALGRIPVRRSDFGLFTLAEQRRAMACLDRVGMADYAAQRASTLSGGQQQRAAIARGLVQEAQLLLADEPIASLDPPAARRVMEMLARINREDGMTVVVSLHQVAYAIAYCPRTIALRDGAVVYDGPSAALTPAFLQQLYGAESETLLLPDVDPTSRPPAEAPPAAAAAFALKRRADDPARPEPTRTWRYHEQARSRRQPLALGIGAAPASAQEIEEINFGIISTESAQNLQAASSPSSTTWRAISACR